MTDSEIIALVASIFTAISGISAAIACFLTYRTTRPKIKLRVGDSQSNRIYTYYENKSFALLGFDIINNSSVGGMVYDLCLIYEGKEYFAEDISTKFDPYPFEVAPFFDKKIEQDATLLRFKTPIVSTGFSIMRGFALFPSFPVVQKDSIVVDIRYRLTNKNFNRKIRNTKFSLVIPTPAKK